MKYLGGKARLAKYIVPLIQRELTLGRPYVEPFVGGGNIAYELPADNSFWADSHPQLIAMWQAVSQGWLPPDNITFDTYKEAQAGKLSPELTGYIGFALSFGGKWFGGFRHGVANSHRHNAVKTYTQLARSSALKKFPKMRGKRFLLSDYRDLTEHIPYGSLIYCDPPYKGTTGYTVKFDTEEFLSWASYLAASKNCTILLSEYQAPSPFKMVWQMAQYKYTSLSSTPTASVERVFVLNPTQSWGHCK